MDFNTAPIDPESAQQLRERGLTLDLVDTTNAEAFTAWMHAETRGFHGPRTSERVIGELLRGIAGRRTSGVWDETGAEPATPVATVSTWPTALTVPGARTVQAWAISSVTVAPTHRRRGVARALLEAELRTAKSLGLPLAMLTVSEATIYSRYGFGPAAMTLDLSIDTRRAHWAGPNATGRVHFVSREQVRDDGRVILERARLRAPGEIELDEYAWGQIAGTVSDDSDTAKQLRAVRYDDADGVPQGFVIYRVAESEVEFAAHTASVRYLVAATEDAYAGLWRYLIELDLVSTVKAPLRAVDEPVVWQVSDFRAARKSAERDHLWVRILDVAAALAARNYSAPGRIVLDVSDPLGFADARVLASIDDAGAATVTPLDGEAPTGAAGLALGVNDLGSLYLGGVSARSLLRAGRITELTPGSADAADASFRSNVAPWLSVWF